MMWIAPPLKPTQSALEPGHEHIEAAAEMALKRSTMVYHFAVGVFN